MINEGTTDTFQGCRYYSFRCTVQLRSIGCASEPYIHHHALFTGEEEPHIMKHMLHNLNSFV